MDQKLPENILEKLEKPTDSSCLDGFIRFIRPEELNPLLQKGYEKSGQAIPFAITAFGDILTWEKDKYICLVSFAKSTVTILESGSEFFFEDLNDKDFIAKYFDYQLFLLATGKFGKLDIDECFGFIPLLSFGGTEDIQRIQKVKINEYLDMAIQTAGKIS